jgi:hypothetical protein
MNFITNNLIVIVSGSCLSAMLFYILVCGFDWKPKPAMLLAPFAVIIVPFFLLIVIPSILFGELMQNVVRKIESVGQPR